MSERVFLKVTQVVGGIVHEQLTNRPTTLMATVLGLLQGNEDGKSAFICPCHLFTNDITDVDYVYHMSTATTRGHRDLSEALSEGVL